MHCKNKRNDKDHRSKLLEEHATLESFKHNLNKKTYLQSIICTESIRNLFTQIDFAVKD